MSFTKVVFFGPIGKTRWPPWPPIGWDIFDFSSKTAERNSPKLDGKSDLNVLYQVFFRPIGKKNKIAALASDWQRHFRLLLYPLNRIHRNLKRSKISTYSTTFGGFRPDRKSKMATPASDWLRHFRRLIWKRLSEFKETWQEARSQRPLPSLWGFCFRADQKIKPVALTSDWLKHFRLLPWKRWTEFNEN